MAWQLYDAATPETYNFAVNPREGGTPKREKNIEYTNTIAPGGAVLVFEGQDQAKTGSISGMLHTQAQLETFEAWMDKPGSVRLTDDLGRQYTVVLTSFNPVRKHRQSRKWTHEWTMEYVILEEL